MGIYVNPDSGRMRTNMRQDPYVDKSMILTELNKLYDAERRFLCVSRPRRFGKTMVGNLIATYYSRGATDSRDIFERMRVAETEGWDAHLGEACVIKVDLNSFYERFHAGGGVIEGMTRKVVEELMSEFPDVALSPDAPLPDAMVSIHQRHGVKFVVIIDEYDVFVRQRATEAEMRSYLSFLNSMFKADDVGVTIALAYLTGIIPIVRDKIQSKLNNFREYTMLRPMELASYIGFTLDEVRVLCEARGMDYGECLRWYDGYRLAPGVSVCNSNSVCEAMASGVFGDYWTATGSYEVVSDYVSLNFDGTRDAVVAMLAGGSAPVNASSFLNSPDSIASRDDVLTYLVHLGYLSYDRGSGECRIPNGEIRAEWDNALRRLDGYRGLVGVVDASRRLLEATLARDGATVAELLDRAHEEATGPLTYNNEGAMQSAVALAYLYARNFYNVVKELPAGRGYADLAFLPLPGAGARPAIVVELKVDRSPDTALDQIRARRYPAALAQYRGEILLVGVSYGKKSRRHRCKIERMTMGN